MKLGFGLALLAALGCSARAPRPPAPPVESASDLVARLRVEPEYRPPPSAPDRVASFYELPRGAYIAQGWWTRACFSTWRTWSRRWKC